MVLPWSNSQSQQGEFLIGLVSKFPPYLLPPSLPLNFVPCRLGEQCLIILFKRNGANLVHILATSCQLLPHLQPASKFLPLLFLQEKICKTIKTHAKEINLATCKNFRFKIVFAPTMFLKKAQGFF